ncbi:glycosyltransferase [Aeromicrobium sp.]|uniref:glycosyltransferase n=1 Tax=Aeromicrobium sp. TaxID=1871063 RepID=UPI0019B33F75|nr:glycosyltransferase [Aeromicrobium sp.]MBC7630842.1 glycosyltransferase [Aeromicrobium sp.]
MPNVSPSAAGRPISISIVVPVYNGEKTLAGLVEEISPLTSVQRTASGLHYIVESVVLAWDHGQDRSDEVIRELAAAHDWVRPVWLSRNFGQHPATCAGMLATGSDWIVTIDEDGQHDPSHIGTMLDQAYADRAQLAYANPSNERPHGPLRNGGSKVAKSMFKWLFGSEAADINFHSYRLVAGEVGRIVAASIGPGVYLDIALLWSIPTVTHVDVPMRTEGRPATSYTTRRLASHFWRLVLSSGTKPLRLVAGIGLTSAVLGFVLGTVLIMQRLFGVVDVRGWTTVVVGGLIGVGLILLSLGVIAEYLGMMASRSMGRSSYLVIRDPATAFPGAIERPGNE